MSVDKLDGTVNANSAYSNAQMITVDRVKNDSKAKLMELAKEYGYDFQSLRNDVERVELIYRNQERRVKNSELKLGGTIIELNNIIKTYKLGRQKVEALRGFSLTVREGEIVAVIGPSGSGKSTVMQLIGGLDKPTSGTVTVDGVSLGGLKDSALSRFRNKTVGFVFQFFYLQPFLTLRTNVEVPLMFARVKSKERHRVSDSIIDKVGLSDRSKHLPKELSGGQMQRAAIARALINNPRIILADEPTGNLDSVNSQSIMDEFLRVREHYNTTIILVTHDEKVAARADRIVRLQDGRVAI